MHARVSKKIRRGLTNDEALTGGGGEVGESFDEQKSEQKKGLREGNMAVVRRAICESHGSLKCRRRSNLKNVLKTSVKGGEKRAVLLRDGCLKNCHGKAR